MEKSFGKFLKERRIEKNLTQKELANILFVSESAVSKWEKDVSHPDITMLPKLASVLGVTEHELITASIDNEARTEKKQARKWKAVSTSWNIFFYISYAITILTCFIVNLAVSGTLDWFFIVLSALVLSFSFTSLHQYIKKYRLVLIPLSMLVSLAILLMTCAIYTKGDWFFVAMLSVILGWAIIFVPIFIAKYEKLSFLNKYNDFVSVFIDFVLLNILLIVINSYTGGAWYFRLALPITLAVFIPLNILLLVRFLRTNKLLKTSIILFLINLYLTIPPLFIKLKNQNAQKELEKFNVFKADFSRWVPESGLNNNIAAIISLTLLALGVGFLVAGVIKHIKNKNK